MVRGQILEGDCLEVPTLEQRVEWLETQVKALRRIKRRDDGQLNLFGQ
jgi:chaperonin cofactor prefoldin